jgi:hypothetical protein
MNALASLLLERLARIDAALTLLRHPLPAPALKPSEVARILRVSERTVKAYIERGELAASSITLGNGVKVYRITTASLEAFLNGRAAAPATGSAAVPRLLRVPRNLV